MARSTTATVNFVQQSTQALAATLERIARAEARFGRAPGSVGLVAVSKSRSAEEIRALAEAGQRRFGENYLQEALGKLEALEGQPLEWHFIGALQSNKTAGVAARFHWVHTVDRAKIARRLSEQRPPTLPPLQVCIEVNVSGEASKSGVAPAELAALAGEVAGLPRLRLRGLMALPAPSEDFEQQRAAFRHLAGLLAGLREAGHELDTLSMGTTGDLEAAVAEGATLVRVGTGVFGPRARR